MQVSMQIALLERKSLVELQALWQKYFDVKPFSLNKEFYVSRIAYKIMPPVQFPKYRGFWPEVVYTPQEIALMDRRPVPPHPTQEQIAIWEKVILQWMPLLDVEERKLVWKRAAHIPWKLLCIEFGWHRSKLNEKYNVAISRIQGFLSGQKSRGHFCKK